MKLSGVRVLDLSQFLPGPHLTMTMADHGADVIMVEPPGGEPARELGARTKDGVTVWFRNIARGKRSVTLDLKTETGRDAFLKLAENADVIVEAFRPGVAKRLGVDYETVAARTPAHHLLRHYRVRADGPLSRQAGARSGGASAGRNGGSGARAA